MDVRQRVYEQILAVKSQPFYPFKWTNIQKLCLLLGDEQIKKGLQERLNEIEETLGVSLYELEALFLHSDSLDNFIKVGGNRVTELDIYNYLEEIDSWLTQELIRIQKNIRFKPYAR